MNLQGIYVPKPTEEGTIQLQVNTFCVHGGPGGRLSGIQVGRGGCCGSVRGGRGRLRCQAACADGRLCSPLGQGMGRAWAGLRGWLGHAPRIRPTSPAFAALPPPPARGR